MTTQPATSTERSTGARVKDFLVTVLVVLVVGPPVAGLLISVRVIMIGVEQGAFGVGYFGEAILLVIENTYLLAWPLAGVTGLLVALWGLWRKPPLLVFLAAAIVGTLVAFPVGSPSIVGAGFFVEPPDWLTTLGLAEVSAAACWLVHRIIPGTA